MKKIIFSALALCAGLHAASLVQAQDPTIYVAPANGFETNIAAAFEKKHVPAMVVTREDAARYVLQPSAVEIHKESGAAKFARCAFVAKHLRHDFLRSAVTGESH